MSEPGENRNPVSALETGFLATDGETRFPKQKPGFNKWRFAWPLFAVLTGVAIWFAFFSNRGPRDDLGKLQGDWNYSTAGRNNLGVIRVEGDTWSYHSGGPFGKSYRMTLRPEVKEIDLALLGDDGQPATFTHGAGQGAEVKLVGIYAIDSGEVKVALGVAERPKSFEDDEAQVLILKR